MDNLSPVEIVGLTIYGEARGEPIEGQIAVGCVIRNRLHDLRGKTYFDICLAPRQFSCWNEDDPNRSMLEEIAQTLQFSNMPDPVLQQCFWIASGVIDWKIMDNTKSAQNYMTTKLYENSPPKWARGMKVSKEIGNHTFLV